MSNGVFSRRDWRVLLATLVFLGLLPWVVNGVPVFESRTTLYLMAPDDRALTVLNTTNTGGLLVLASAVEADLNKSVKPMRFSDAQTTLFDGGVRDGVSIAVPNDGGQWAVSLQRAVLVVDVVGGSFRSVENQRNLAISRVRSALRELQIRMNIPARDQARVEAAAGVGAVSLVGGDRVTRIPGILAYVVLFVSLLAFLRRLRSVRYLRMSKHFASLTERVT